MESLKGVWAGVSRGWGEGSEPGAPTGLLRASSPGLT